MNQLEFTSPDNVSILKDGDLYKIAVPASGLYKIDYNYLKNELGANTIDSKNPKNIQLFSFGGQVLPELVSDTYDTGLKEHAIFIDGESDNKFDTRDFILFYANGPDREYLSPSDGMIVVDKNPYSRLAHYILKIGSETGKRIKSNPLKELQSPKKISSSIQVHHYEEEKVNLLAGRTVTYGSGKEWYGDYFKSTRKKDYTFAFDLSSIEPGKMSKFKIAFAARSDEFTEAFFQIDQSKHKLTLSHTNTGDVEDDIARETTISNSVVIQANSKLNIDYPSTNFPSEGWLNYITLNTPIELSWNDKPLLFYSPLSENADLEYQVSKVTKPIDIWNVKDLFNVTVQESKTESNIVKFYRPFESGLELFIAFDKQFNFPSPIKFGKLANQNLAAIADADAIIIYHKDFETAADKWIQHKKNQSTFQAKKVLLEDIYNEFSAGQQDPTAIRNFARRMWLNNPKFNYLVLLGDGSYNYLKISSGSEFNDENFIPVYETDESLNPIYAFPSDDYYALLQPGEGTTGLYGNLDIAIGRIPARTKDEAELLINKIIDYDKNNASGSDDWKLRIAFGADDEDSNIHLDQSERISGMVDQKYPVYNIQKIYLDAFKEISGAAGEVTPGANQSLSDEIYKGLLVFNYLGHGGPKGLSQEGLLRNSDVESWANKDKLPLIITATCSFAPYDDPNVNSTGEALFRSPYGGAIALLTTVRNVYSSSNELLTNSVFQSIFEKDSQGNPLTLGEIMKNGKNKISDFSNDRTNTRKFALIGDPTQRLAIPKYKVRTTHIQSKAISSQSYDTLKALQPIKIQGEITDAFDTKISAYSGEVSVTLFDKKSVIKTLGQNPSSFPQTFEVQNSVLYKGSAKINNGVFTLEFVLPKDIDYRIGLGKISYFATNDQHIDADGVYEKIYIGGSVTALIDDKAPSVKAYINHFLFTNGDETHANPLLLVKLFDENGINATGNSIGHDLLATLDGKSQFVLNNFYSSTIGDYKSGLVQFPLKNLTPGLHSLHIKAWDIANNSATDSIYFYVVDTKSKARILSLTAFPNPVKDQVTISFTHNANVTAGSKIRYSLFAMDGKKLFQNEEVLSPAPVSHIPVQLPHNLNTGTFYLFSLEILNGTTKLDSKGIKLLRIP